MMNIIAGYFADVDGSVKSAFRRNECPLWLLRSSGQCSVVSERNHGQLKENPPVLPFVKGGINEMS